jgi:DNA polymerase I-like protein with 3'-5' exonuclease and polymerase domains
MLVQADASQIEWRLLLYLAQDMVGINEIIEKQDTHSLNEKAFDLPSRLIAKIYLFSTIYRAKGWSFANNPDFMHVSTDPAFWDGVSEKFYSKYYAVDKKHKEWADTVLHGKPLVSPFGREWLIPMKETRFGLEIPWTTLTNYPVQGSAADVMMVARISFARRLQAMGLSSKFRGDVKLISTVHDSIVTDVEHEEDVQEVVNLFHQVFDDLPKNLERLFDLKWNVPLDCECKAGLNMKERRGEDTNTGGMVKMKRTDK